MLINRKRRRTHTLGQEEFSEILVQPQVLLTGQLWTKGSHSLLHCKFHPHEAFRRDRHNSKDVFHKSQENNNKQVILIA